MDLSAAITAWPIRWVNDTLPPRPRRRWLLMTIRLSTSSLAGTARTLVAVGTPRLAIMLVTVRAAAPRSLLTSAPGPAGGVCGAGVAAGAGGAWKVCDPGADGGAAGAVLAGAVLRSEERRVGKECRS